MNIQKLLGDRVLVEPLPVVNASPGGIFLPQTMVPKQPLGTIRMVGTGKVDKALQAAMAEVKVGDMVRCDMNLGFVPVMHEGVLHRIHSIIDIIAICDPEVAVDLAQPGSEQTVAVEQPEQPQSVAA